MRKQIIYKILIHLLFWVVFGYLTVNYLRNWLPTVQVNISLVQLLNYTWIYLIVLAAAPYFNYFILIPRFFSRRRYMWYTVLLLVAYVLASLLICWLEALFLRGYGQTWLYTMPHLVSRLPYLVLFTLLGNWLALSEELTRKQQAEKQLRTERTEAELRWLKAQVNPHFLFNALNNIHSLVHFKEDNAGPMLVKLSDMMRYMFYDSSAAKVPLAKEVAYIDSFIELHLLKKKYRCKVQFEKNIQEPAALVEPMLFINFIENAFKHGNLDDADGYVRLSLTITGSAIHFACTNSYTANMVKDATQGIGLHNVQQRLGLLYHQRHLLRIDDSGSIYTVDLTIELQN